MTPSPVDDFFKFAAEAKAKHPVHVHAYDRKGPTGVEHVHEYDRMIDEVTPLLDLAPADDAILTTDMAEPPGAAEADVEASETDEPLTAEEEEETRKDLQKVEQGKLTRLTPAEELEHWQRWKDGGEHPEDLKDLLHSLQPLIRHRMRAYHGRVRLIPDAAIEAEFNIRAVEALKSYKPDRGATIATHVYRYLEKAKRFIAENQNVGRIPENRVYKIRQYQKVRNDILEDTGKIPSVAELAKKLNWSVAETDRLDSELRNDLTSQGFENDPYSVIPSKSEEVLRLFKYELAGNERTVYEYLTGQDRDRMTSTGAIARKMGIPDYQVSRIKDGIQRKLQRHLAE